MKTLVSQSICSLIRVADWVSGLFSVQSMRINFILNTLKIGIVMSLGARKAVCNQADQPAQLQRIAKLLKFCV